MKLKRVPKRLLGIYATMTNVKLKRVQFEECMILVTQRDISSVYVTWFRCDDMFVISTGIVCIVTDGDLPCSDARFSSFLE